MNGKPAVTVFTPTYNRAHLLGKTFDSLRRQTFQDFEWVIVDDGSEDQTPALVERWIDEATFPIRYTWQSNQGKHVAINRGVEMARGQCFVILDSDDWLLPNTLNSMLENWESIPSKARSNFVGVAGLYALSTGGIVGTEFPHSVLDSNAVEIRTRFSVRGDKFGMNRTETLRQFPFPEDLGRYVSMGLIWNRIAQNYSIRYVNEVFALTEYQSGGLSERSRESRVLSNAAARLYYKELAQLRGRYISLWGRLKACANYARFSLHGGISVQRQYAEIDNRACWLLGFTAGLVAYAVDNRVLKR
jgi:glycosyltransferase involved in cell wall biosynthesis